MRKFSLDEAMPYLLANEGKFVDHPYDSGGATMYGIPKRRYERFLGHPIEMDAFKKMSVVDATGFYRVEFWVPLMCDSMHDGAIAIALFDTSILYGQETTVLMAQKALIELGFGIERDGLIGEETLAALNAVPRDKFLSEFHGHILKRIGKIVAEHPKNKIFLNGWWNRADRLLTLATYVPFNKKNA